MLSPDPDGEDRGTMSPRVSPRTPLHHAVAHASRPAHQAMDARLGLRYR